MKEELSIFFQICKNPVLLNKYKDIPVIQRYCEIVSDNFITFPMYSTEDLKYRGYPNNEYLENRWHHFEDTLEKILTSNKEEQIFIIKEFLESCHGDDTTRDDKNNIHEPEYLFYHYLFTKSNKIPMDRIYKVYPELKKEKETTEFPATAYRIPFGTIIELEYMNGVLKFNDVQNSNIQLDFLRLPYRKSFTAKIVVSPKWFKYDINYYKDKNAKWQELRIQGIKANDIKIYILECSRNREWFKELLESVGIKVVNLPSITLNNNKELKEALVNCLTKDFRALLINNDVYVVKPTTSKLFKIEGDMPSSSYPWDLINFDIHYSLIPETLL